MTSKVISDPAPRSFWPPPSVERSEPHWPSRCFLNVPEGVFSPQDGCPCCSLSLECSFCNLTSYPFIFFRSFLKCHFSVSSSLTPSPHLPTHTQSLFLAWFMCLCACAKPIQSCLTLCNPMGHSLPGSSVHGILQARKLWWVAISYCRGSSRLRDWTHISCVLCIGRWVLYH